MVIDGDAEASKVLVGTVAKVTQELAAMHADSRGTQTTRELANHVARRAPVESLLQTLINLGRLPPAPKAG